MPHEQSTDMRKSEITMAPRILHSLVWWMCDFEWRSSFLMHCNKDFGLIFYMDGFAHLVRIYSVSQLDGAHLPDCDTYHSRSCSAQDGYIVRWVLEWQRQLQDIFHTWRFSNISIRDGSMGDELLFANCRVTTARLHPPLCNDLT